MTEQTRSLEELIQHDSGLSEHEAIRLADAWKADVLQELQSSGISVVRGLGTFTVVEGKIQFQQDADFPSLSDTPAVEGFSARLAAESALGEVQDEMSDVPEPVTVDVETASLEDSEDVNDSLPVDAPDAAVKEAQHNVPEHNVPEHNVPEHTVPEHNVPEHHVPEHHVPELADDDVNLETGGSSQDHPDAFAERDADWAMGVEHAIEAADRRVEGTDKGSSSLEGEALESSGPDNLGSGRDRDPDQAEQVPDQPASVQQASERAPDQPASDQAEAESVSDAMAPGTTSTEAAPAATGPDESVPAKSHTTVRSRSPRRYERDEGGSSRAALWTLGAVVLVVIAALIYRFAISPSPEDPAFANQDAAEETGVLADSSSDSAMASTDSTAVAGSEEGTQTADSNRPPVPSEESAPPTPGSAPAAADNSRGDVDSTIPRDEIVRGMGGYTLVVGSTLNEQTARNALSSFRSLGLPMGVLAYESEDPTRYRIAVGLYGSAVEADSARNRLASDLPEGTWVLSVR